MLRQFTSSLLLLTLISSASCSLARGPIEAEDKYQISEITLERSGSWGILSGYKVVLRQDGAAEYAGDIHAKRNGKYLGQISLEQFAQLAKVIVENDYFSLIDKYSATVKDSDTITTSVVYSGGRKTVEDYGREGGEKLTAIELAIDNMADQIIWVRYWD